MTNAGLRFVEPCAKIAFETPHRVYFGASKGFVHTCRRLIKLKALNFRFCESLLKMAPIAPIDPIDPIDPVVP